MADCLSIKLQKDHQTSIITAHLASHDILMTVWEQESVINRTGRVSVEQITTLKDARTGDISGTAEILWLQEK